MFLTSCVLRNLLFMGQHLFALLCRVLIVDEQKASLHSVLTDDITLNPKRQSVFNYFESKRFSLMRFCIIQLQVVV